MTGAGEALPLGWETLSGEVLRPGDAGYDEARRVHNGLIDKRPALIARCGTVREVVAAVDFGRPSGLEISIRGGGHNVAGVSVCDGGLMIDLSPMKKIDVDAERRLVRAQPGVTWSELNEQTAAHGLVVTGGVVSTTGIAGLTLGGGFGWLMPKFSLAADNLVSAEVVTADGRVLTARTDENADLFLGPPGRRRQLRHRHVVRVPAARAQANDHGWPDRLRFRRGRRGVRVLPRLWGSRPCARTASRIAQAQRIARAGPSKPEAKNPSPSRVDLAAPEVRELAPDYGIVLPQQVLPSRAKLDGRRR
jgi:hypothetical protein